MARFAHTDRQRVDEVLERWRDECLLADGSLLFDGEQVWTHDHAVELVERFNEQQLDDDRTFEEKLTAQVGSASQGAQRLMAEVIAAYFLFSTNVGGARKRELVGFVLGMAGDTFPTTAT
jgi:5-methylcytosine-specific restriction protein B